MHQIVYTSRSTRDWTELDLENLASLSSRLNLSVGVTGLLLYDGSRFIQALEGSKSDTTATMARITRDQRHDSIRILNDGSVDRRQFGDWSMLFKRTPEGCCSQDFLNRVMDDVDAVDDAHLKAAFIGFASLGSKRPEGYVCSAN